MSVETAKPQITEALSALGTTSDQIAANLASLGYRGKRGEARACPIFRYLNDRFPEVIDEVSCGAVWLVLDDDGELGEVGLGEAADEFIARFDGSAYEELVELEAVTS